MHFSKVIAGTILLGLVGCGSPTGNGYFDSGAGLSLYTPGTPKATEDLRNYYRELCKQADPLQEPDKEGKITCEPNKNVLVRTGFNDIDLRCDGYLAWIDRQRTDARTFRNGSTAVNTLATGLGTVSERSIRNIAQILGFANSIYDAYNSSILTGIESSTIKKLVYARRAAFRKEFSGLEYPTYADATYALRRYLNICTPQTIVLTTNEFAIAAVNGSPPNLAKDAREQASVLSAPKPNDPAKPPRRDLGAVPTFSAIFSEPGFDKSHVELIQKAGCIGVTGKADKATVSTVKMLQQIYPQKLDRDNKLSTAEWDGIHGDLKTAGICDSGKFKNVFEHVVHSDQDGAGAVTSIVDYLILQLTKNNPTVEAELDDKDKAHLAEMRALKGQPFFNPDIRKFLSELRKSENVPDSFPGLGDLSGQLTPNLMNRFEN